MIPPQDNLTGTGLYIRSMGNLQSARGYVRNVQSFYQAKAGGTYVIDELGDDIAAGNISFNQPVISVNYPPPSGFSFDPVTELRRLGDDRAYMFEVTGRAGTARTTFEIIFRGRSGQGFGDFFADGQITLSGGGNSIGNVRGNNDIVRSGGSTLTGDAMAGPGFTVNDPGQVSGDSTAAADSLVLDPVNPVDLAYYSANNDNNQVAAPYYTEDGVLLVQGGNGSRDGVRGACRCAWTFPNSTPGPVA